MIKEDLKSISTLGRALWVDPDYSRRVTVETVSAVSLLDLAPERGVERATLALLERAMNDGVGVNAAVAQIPFYRLLPQERLLLAGLHLAHWSYARLGRILGITSAEVAEMAWQARLHLASQSAGIHPTGSQFRGVSCPEYNLRTPWTQRFLDEEMATSERIFIQNHLMACDSCRHALVRCRELYYKVDALIPRPVWGDDPADILERTWRESYGYIHPIERSFVESLRIFLRRPEVFWLLVVLALFIIAKRWSPPFG